MLWEKLKLGSYSVADDAGLKKTPEENGTMMLELSFNLPTIFVWLKQAILSITLFLKYFKMTLNVQLTLPKADDEDSADQPV